MLFPTCFKCTSKWGARKKPWVSSWSVPKHRYGSLISPALLLDEVRISEAAAAGITRARREIARVQCNADPSLPPGMVELLIVPAANDAIANGNLTALQVPIALRNHVVRHLEPYRLLTTQLVVREPRYLGVSVQAEIIPHPHTDPELVCERTRAALRQFLSPLDIGRPSVIEPGEDWQGWPFGRDLYVADLFGLLQQVAGVRYVRDVRFASIAVAPGQELNIATLTQTADNVTRMLHVPADTLICSLEHTVTAVTL